MKNWRMLILALLGTGLLFLVTPALSLAQTGGGQFLTLAEDDQTRYQIVAALDADSEGIETYAAKTLAAYLQEITGAAFPVVSPDEWEADRPAIFIGLSEPALARLEPEPLAKLRDQEHVARNVGPDILLYGKRHRASLDAVMAGPTH